MASNQILIAGFGGQGILFAGKFLAYKGMVAGKEVSWLPSYGPEMRGGTASCSVILSDEPIGSPIITHPDCLVAMNLPSLEKYKNTVAPGGKIFLDSTLIHAEIDRDDVQVFAIPATQMALDAGVSTLANMVMVGKLIRECEDMSFDGLDETLHHVVSARRASLLELNKTALDAGYHFEG